MLAPSIEPAIVASRVHAYDGQIDGVGALRHALSRFDL